MGPGIQRKITDLFKGRNKKISEISNGGPSKAMILALKASQRGSRFNRGDSNDSIDLSSLGSIDS